MSAGEHISSDDITRHVQADPQLKKQMLERKLIWWFMGRYYFTAKGKAEMQRRAQARVNAQQKGLVAMPGEGEQ